MSRWKIALIALLVWIVTLGAGWIWGAWGRWAAETQVARAALRSDLAESRAALLAARIDLFELNFGEASRHIERARPLLDGAAGTFERLEAPDAAAAMREALGAAIEAQRLAGALDQGGHAKLTAAVRALERAMAASPR